MNGLFIRAVQFSHSLIHVDWKLHPQICHPDRSVAQWRDLLFTFSQADPSDRTETHSTQL